MNDGCGKRRQFSPHANRPLNFAFSLRKKKEKWALSRRIDTLGKLW
jgi:hypothetical protein